MVIVLISTTTPEPDITLEGLLLSRQYLTLDKTLLGNVLLKMSCLHNILSNIIGKFTNFL